MSRGGYKAVEKPRDEWWGLRVTRGGEVTKRMCVAFSRLARAGEKFSAHQEVLLFEKIAGKGNGGRVRAQKVDVEGIRQWQ